MTIEFTYVPRTSFGSEGDASFFEIDEARNMLELLEEVGFSRVVIDDIGGILSNLDLAGQTARQTRSLDIVVTHWAGVVSPVAAAQQIAAIDRTAGGRVSLRIPSEASYEEDSGDTSLAHAEFVSLAHAELMARTDEYLMLLKRLWSNDEPFDYEGAYHRVKDGFVGRKSPYAASLPLRMTGLSGTSLKVAGRHADVFELPPANPLGLVRLMERLRVAASEFGRGGKISFALPVDVSRFGMQGPSSPTAEEGESEVVCLPGDPAGIARRLAAYSDIGVSEFMVHGLDTQQAISDFAEKVMPLVEVRTRGAHMTDLPGARISHIPGYLPRHRRS